MRSVFAPSLRTHPGARRLGGALALLILLLDRLTKIWVLDGLGLAPGESIRVLPIFSLTFVWNEGISLGLFQQGTEAGQWALIALTGAISIFLIVWLARTREWLGATAIGLVLGGAVGNIWDRIAFGAVADFLHFHVGALSFYIFNIADAAITIGVILLLLDSFRRGSEEADQ